MSARPCQVTWLYFFPSPHFLGWLAWRVLFSFSFLFLFLFLISFLISGRDVFVHVSWSYLALPWAWVLGWGFLLFWVGWFVAGMFLVCLMVIGLWDW
jgi:hypothetical protein